MFWCIFWFVGVVTAACGKLDYPKILTQHDIDDGATPLEFGECPVTQHCLFMKDDALGNNALSTVFVLPLLENAVNVFNPTSAYELLENGKILFDDNSVLTIDGVGVYKGTFDISNYLAIPHSSVSNVSQYSLETIDSVKYWPSSSQMQFQVTHVGELVRFEQVIHIAIFAEFPFLSV